MKDSGRYTYQRIYDTTASELANGRDRLLGKGWTPGKTLRRVASIPVEDVIRLGKEGNLDAVMAMNGDDGAMRRLIRAHPEWRCSEGRV
jgi:hypothetical protein